MRKAKKMMMTLRRCCSHRLYFCSSGSEGLLLIPLRRDEPSLAPEKMGRGRGGEIEKKAQSHQPHLQQQRYLFEGVMYKADFSVHDGGRGEIIPRFKSHERRNFQDRTAENDCDVHRFSPPGVKIYMSAV